MTKQLTQSQLQITKHASSRMDKRSIKEWQVEHVLDYGRRCYSRKAIIYAVGRNEVRRNGRFLESCEGIHVICSPQDETIFTTYRNHDMRYLRR